MAQGQYKDGVQINLVYQAAGLLANAIPVGTVYDQGSAVHSAETTALTSALLAGELTDPADGRYLGHFTPNAEGMWTVVIKDKNGAGEVTKMYDVAGHDLDSVGDAIATLDTNISDVESAVNVQITALVDAESGIKSDLVKVESGLKSAVSTSLASAVLIAKNVLSGLISDVESALNVNVSAVAALDASLPSQILLVISAVSDVESAVDLIASPASVS